MHAKDEIHNSKRKDTGYFCNQEIKGSMQRRGEEKERFLRLNLDHVRNISWNRSFGNDPCGSALIFIGNRGRSI